MKQSLQDRLKRLMLPGLKRWILIILTGILLIVVGVLLALGYHPLTVSGMFVREMMEHAVTLLPHRISGISIIVVGCSVVFYAIAKLTLTIVGAFLPKDREAIADRLYKQRYLDRGPKVVVVGGGTGLSNLLKGLKVYSSNLTAVVTVGDDGGSSGRLRQELGILPPGDIRNCITALADDEQIVTELFRYRFEHGDGLEGHSFGNLFLSAVCAITGGDMLQAARVASRVLNSRGQVLPATSHSMSLIAEMTDGRVIEGESHITQGGGRIHRLRTEPAHPDATPEAIEAILEAELIILGPGSLYTSVVPNLLIKGIPAAIARSQARKIYVCNVVTQAGETTGYSVADHVEAIIIHSGIQAHAANRIMQAVLVNTGELPPHSGNTIEPDPVIYDPEKLRGWGIVPVRRPIVHDSFRGHHDPDKLAKELFQWFEKEKAAPKAPVSPPPPDRETTSSGRV